MDDGLKQRLVGAVVLVAIGVIFVPGLLDKDGRREIDLNTQVPPEPVVMPRPLEVPDPERPDNIPPAKPLEENYAHLQPEELFVAEEIEDQAQEVIDNTIPEAEPSPPVANKLSGLDQNGVPLAWSVQVSSFESQSNATAFEKKLVEAGYAAYIRSTTANNITVHRVFVGPKINRQSALETKVEIDKAYKTQSLLIEFKP